jgi:ribosomal protein S18 acetylase RimI-like enzyme
MNIVEINKYSKEILEAHDRLLPQLTNSEYKLSESALKSIILDNSIHLIMVKIDDIYCASLTLGINLTPTGKKAHIEDVVVDNNYRGKGIGEKICKYAIELSKKLQVQSIALTSNSKRLAANALYKKIGFQLKETNVYMYDCQNN